MSSVDVTYWYLTPAGWQEGVTTDGDGAGPKDEGERPAGVLRVATFNSPNHMYAKPKWHTTDIGAAADVAAAVEKFGARPRKTT